MSPYMKEDANVRKSKESEVIMREPENPVGGTINGPGGTMSKFDFQSAHPGGVVEQKRKRDCEVLIEHFNTCYTPRNTRQLSRELKWSRRRVRAVIRSARSVIDREVGIGEHGATEHRWFLKEV